MASLKIGAKRNSSYSGLKGLGLKGLELNGNEELYTVWTPLVMAAGLSLRFCALQPHDEIALKYMVFLEPTYHRARLLISRLTNRTLQCSGAVEGVPSRTKSLNEKLLIIYKELANLRIVLTYVYEQSNRCAGTID